MSTHTKLIRISNELDSLEKTSGQYHDRLVEQEEADRYDRMDRQEEEAEKRRYRAKKRQHDAGWAATRRRDGDYDIYENRKDDEYHVLVRYVYHRGFYRALLVEKGYDSNIDDYIATIDIEDKDAIWKWAKKALKKWKKTL